MRRLGAMPYMTPLQSATESSTTPKSVMKTTVGGGAAAGCARRGPAARSNKAVAATHHTQNIRADFAAGMNVIRITSPSRVAGRACRPLVEHNIVNGRKPEPIARVRHL